MANALNADVEQLDVGSTDAFRVRMECQCSEIERYRLAELHSSGRELSPDEAAVEWIDRYAEDFARNYHPPAQ